jgi:predicted MFS family arabinose efflux permease
VGRGPAFATMAILGLGLAAWASTLPRPTGHEEARTGTIRAALRDPPFVAGLWITLLPSVSFGVVEVLAPLDLDAFGASGTAIAGVFFLAALVEAVVSPLTGRWADRHGMRGILRAGLLASAAGLVALAFPRDAIVLGAVLVGASGALGMLWTPGGHLVSLSADRLGLNQGYAFAINNVGWSGGVAVGSAAGGALGGLWGDAVPYALVAGLCLVTAARFWSGRQVPSVRS